MISFGSSKLPFPSTSLSVFCGSSVFKLLVFTTGCEDKICLPIWDAGCTPTSGKQQIHSLAYGSIASPIPLQGNFSTSFQVAPESRDTHGIQPILPRDLLPVDASSSVSRPLPLQRKLLQHASSPLIKLPPNMFGVAAYILPMIPGAVKISLKIPKD